MMQWTLSRAMRRLALWRPDWLTSAGLLSLRAVMVMRCPLRASPMSNRVVGNVDGSLFLQFVANLDDHLQVDSQAFGDVGVVEGLPRFE